MQNVIDGKSKERKIILLSGHKINVVACFNEYVLGVWYPHVPSYASSAIILELLADDDDGSHYVRVITDFCFSLQFLLCYLFISGKIL